MKPLGMSVIVEVEEGDEDDVGKCIVRLPDGTHLRQVPAAGHNRFSIFNY